VGLPRTQLRYGSRDNFTERMSTDRMRAPEPKGEGTEPISAGDDVQGTHGDTSPIFTNEESIVIRSVSAGKCDKQLCIELRMPLQAFQGLLCDLMAKTGTTDRIGLLIWATRRKQGQRDYKTKTTRLRIKYE
jgi:hypothetical protein